MVLSIRKISTENEDLTGAGALWFPNLNEADPYMLLPFMATALNYFNLGVSQLSLANHLHLERNHERERALVCEQIQVILPDSSVLPSAIHVSVASGSVRILDLKLPLRGIPGNSHQIAVVPQQSQPELLL